MQIGYFFYQKGVRLALRLSAWKVMLINAFLLSNCPSTLLGKPPVFCSSQYYGGELHLSAFYLVFKLEKYLSRS